MSDQTYPIAIDEDRVRHLFREAPGHFREDNAMNRRTLIDVANRSPNFCGTDQFGNAWFAETRADGTQVWVRVRDNKITNGGVNQNPQDLSFPGVGS